VAVITETLTGQHKGCDAADEPGEERVKGEGAHKAAVQELNGARQQDVEEVRVDDLLVGDGRKVSETEGFKVRK
jgi:hypothetical protein